MKESEMSDRALPTPEWMHVGPEQAKALLKMNRDNRNVRPKVVARMARDMSAGRWVITHQGVAISVTGRLLDGQHRLLAVVRSGSPQWMLVVRNVPDEAQRHMDRMAARSPADFLEGPNARVRVAAIRMLLSMELVDWTVTPTALASYSQVVTDADVYAFTEQRRGVSEDLLSLSTGAMSAARQAPVTASALLAAALIYPDIADEVLEGLASGAGLEVGDPVLLLRNIPEDAVRKVAPTRATYAGVHLALRVFDLASRGEKRRQLKIAPGGVFTPIDVKPVWD